MTKLAAVWGILALSGACAQAPPRLDPSQQALLDRVAEYAREYERQLPDFICTRITQRSQDKSGAGDRWQLMDTMEEELTYAGGRETYRVLSFNGRPVKPTAHLPSGFKSNGEFGAILVGILAPDKHAQFNWEGAEDSGGRRTAVWGFRVSLEHSDYKISEGGKKIPVAFGGRLHVVADSGRVERLSFQTDTPEGISATGIATDIRFVDVMIAGRPYLLPGRAEAITRYKRSLLKRVMEFRDYHKYAADSSVTFEPPK